MQPIGESVAPVKKGEKGKKGDVPPAHLAESVGANLLSFWDKGRSATVGKVKAKRWMSGTSPFRQKGRQKGDVPHVHLAKSGSILE